MFPNFPESEKNREFRKIVQIILQEELNRILPKTISYRHGNFYELNEDRESRYIGNMTFVTNPMYPCIGFISFVNHRDEVFCVYLEQKCKKEDVDALKERIILVTGVNVWKK